MNNKLKEIYLAGGCFWGLQKYLDAITGVVFTEVGYANGNTKNPTYEDVCLDFTGYAETVYVRYDSQKLDLKSLLSLYYDVIDPRSINRQGPDEGSQYRTGIYFLDPNDLPEIKESIEKLGKDFLEPIAIEIEPLKNYYKAEEYHQKYLDKNPGGYCHISPEKIKNVSTKFPPSI